MGPKGPEQEWSWLGESDIGVSMGAGVKGLM